FDEGRRRGPAFAEALVVVLDAAQDLAFADRIDVAEGPTAERREAQAEEGTDVAGARTAQDSPTPAVGRLVHELERAAHLNLFGQNSRFSLGVGHRKAEHAIDALVDVLALALLLGHSAVEVEALLVLLPLAVVRQ